MKCVLVGDFNPNSTNISLGNCLSNFCDVYRFDYRSPKFKPEKNISLYVSEYCVTHCVDFVVFCKCRDFLPHSIDMYGDTTKVMWYMDPVNGNFTSNFIKIMSKCDLVFCNIYDAYLECLKYNKNSFHLQEGFDPLIDKPYKAEKKYDVSFIGSLRGHRGEYIEHIGAKVIQNAYKGQHGLEVGQSRINLNFTDGGASDRVYKVLAAQGFLLTEAWPNMENDFVDGKDLVVFNGKKDLVEKVVYYLANEDQRLKIAEHGCKTVQKFSRDFWAKTICDKVKEYKK